MVDSDYKWVFRNEKGFELCFLLRGSGARLPSGSPWRPTTCFDATFPVIVIPFVTATLRDIVNELGFIQTTW